MAILPEPLFSKHVLYQICSREKYKRKKHMRHDRRMQSVRKLADHCQEYRERRKNISSGKPDIFTSGIWIYLEDRICIYVCGRGAHIKTVVCIHVRQHCAHYYLKSNQKNCQTEIKIKMNFFLCQRRDFILFHQAENAPYGKGCSCQAKTDRQYMKRSFQPCHWKRKKFHNGKKRQISCKKCFPYAPCLFFL